MSDKKFRYSNGTVLDTEPEAKAYTRGLEVARQTLKGEDGAAALNGLIEESHQVKNAGPKPEVEETAAATDEAAAENAEGVSSDAADTAAKTAE